MRTAPKKKSLKPKKTKASIWAQYGLKRPPQPRFEGLAGVLWYVLSRYVRKSEFQTYGGYCVDGCGRKVEDWRDADCGHFMASSRGFATRFLRENLGLQTKYCNNPLWSPDSAYGFSRVVDQRYGLGTAERLERLSRNVSKGYSALEYDREIRRYLELFEAL